MEGFIMNKIITSSFTAILLCLAAAPASAGNLLTAEQITGLVKGNTVHANHLKKGFNFSVYFDSDGKTAIRKQNGEETETTYHIADDKHCIYWNGKDRCASVRDNGDGTYTRVNANGKDIVAWKKIVSGKDL